MTATALATSGLLFVLLLNAMPVAFAMLVAGSVGLYLVGGIFPLVGVLKSGPYEHVASFTLSTLPMFVLVGAIFDRSGVAGQHSAGPQLAAMHRVRFHQRAGDPRPGGGEAQRQRRAHGDAAQHRRLGVIEGTAIGAADGRAGRRDDDGVTWRDRGHGARRRATGRTGD